MSIIENARLVEADDLTLAGLVHDLNNVFQTLLEAADLLSTDPRWVPLSAVIARSVERGRTIAASMQTGEHPSASFDTVVRNAIAFMEDSILAGRKPEIRFTCEIEPGIELRRIWAWERVLINLFSNAVRAMPRGGLIHVRALQHGQDIQIVGRDEGPG